MIDTLNPRVETPEEVRDALLEASKWIPKDQLGATDDCGMYSNELLPHDLSNEQLEPALSYRAYSRFFALLYR